MRLMKFIVIVTVVFSAKLLACTFPGVEKAAAQYAKHDAPGFVFLVAQNNTVVCKKAVGLANIELGVPVNANTVFEIGSLTKLFTATAILLLEQQEKLNRNDLVSRYIPGITSQKSPVTIAHLLSHTSGLVDPINEPEFLATRINDDTDLDSLIQEFKNGRWAYEPGQHVIYSNVGYSMLASIIEKASEMAYEEALQKMIFRPLNMQHTHQASFQIVKGKATGYTFDGATPRQHDFLNWRWAFGAADLLSTVDDLNTFNSALMQGKLLNADQLSALTRPIALNDGSQVPGPYNYSIEKVGGKRALRMNGSTMGYSSHSAYLQDSKTFVVVLSNSDGINGGGWTAPEVITNSIIAAIAFDESTKPEK
ncbi:serine hydrolase domain-containing protein [Alteromonas confluentis]|uniref:Beta-lactamase-related domain-containing protein n=1 Tax=Alteromonas confluentis TaxID=1656094 RepID=A0A1E7Z756_9ALTE|nr:serine hydrolase domain-containing protein [Alteromonas confluentis]OFC69368.1 hypothetical protein BFC18_18310 [Alteromonas confluentis]